MADTDNGFEQANFALEVEEIMAAIRELHGQGGIDDVFGRLPADDTEPPG
jgi:hypothetical protein